MLLAPYSTARWRPVMSFCSREARRKGRAISLIASSEELGPPGIVAHGVALKPGKPLCLGVVPSGVEGRRPIPVAVLPGFPTSAIFTFQEFIAPVLLSLAGRPPAVKSTVAATIPARVNSERGRTEYVLVGLVPQTNASLVAIPMGKGSGSVTAFGRADGFITIPRSASTWKPAKSWMFACSGWACGLWTSS